NRLHLQATDNESAAWERRIIESRRSGFAALTTADSMNELRAKHQAFERLPTVAEVTSVLTLIPTDQDRKITMIHDIVPVVTGLRFGTAADVDVDAVRRALAGLERRIGIAAQEAEAGKTAESLRSAQQRAGVLLTRLTRDDGRVIRDQLRSVQT